MVRKNMMAVNGVWVPDPDGLEVTYSVLDKYAKRNMSAQLSRKIAGKKLEICLELGLHARAGGVYRLVEPAG